MSWQLFNAGAMLLRGREIQVIISFRHPNVLASHYQAFLLSVAVMLVSVAVALSLGPRMSIPLYLISALCLGTAVGGTVLIEGIIAPKLAPSQAFSLVSMSAPTYMVTNARVLEALRGMVGILGMVHMVCVPSSRGLTMVLTPQKAEEVNDASVTLPQAMVAAYILSFFVSLGLMVVQLLSLVDVDTAASSLQGQSGFIYLYLLCATMDSVTTADWMGPAILLANCASATLILTFTSRQVFAFARNGGLPLSRWLATTHRKLAVPVNSVVLTTAFAMALASLWCLSPRVIEVIADVQLFVTMATNVVSIGWLLHRRLFGRDVPQHRWSLGRFGLWINAAALAFCLTILWLLCMPTSLPVTVRTLSWTPIVGILSLGLPMAMYLSYSDSRYSSPKVGLCR